MFSRCQVEVLDIFSLLTKAVYSGNEYLFISRYLLKVNKFHLQKEVLESSSGVGYLLNFHYN